MASNKGASLKKRVMLCAEEGELHAVPDYASLHPDYQQPGDRCVRRKHLEAG